MSGSCRLQVSQSTTEARRRSREVVAFLKVGWKRLLLLDDTREVHDVMTPSILDFCVRAHYRRRGVGRKLFDCMLAYEGRQPWELPIDNPSSRMRFFLRRHYGLDAELESIPQLNRFTVFRGFPFDRQTTVSDEGQRESCHGRCIQERRNDSVLRCILRDYDGRYDQTSAHKNRRWVEEPIYQQKEPRHSSEHRNYNSAFFHRGENSHNFEKDSTSWCCNQEYSQRMIRQSRSAHLRMRDNDLRTAGPRSSSSSWRVLGLEGPGNLNYQIS